MGYGAHHNDLADARAVALTEAKMSDSEENLISTAAMTSQLVAAATLVEKANAK
jgi:hypothetical protein